MRIYLIIVNGIILSIFIISEQKSPKFEYD